MADVHTEFWLAVATAAPVIGVAIAVSLPSVLSPSQTLVDAEDENTAQGTRRKRAGSVLSLLFLLATIALLMFLFAVSLLSLAGDRDRVGVDLAAVLTIVLLGATFAYALSANLVSAVVQIRQRR